MSFFGQIVQKYALAGRRLAFESLERRDLLTIIRLVDWNTLNRPNDATDVGNFQTILAAIGNETIAGNTKRLDILAVQETDPAVSPGNNSIGQIESILDALYPSTDYASAVTSVDGGGDSTGFIYDTSTLSLVQSIEVPGALTHKIMRGQFRPVETLGESDFFVYTIHLKSGDTPSDASLRASEALVLRNDADSLGEGANVLFVGDFNMKTSSEVAWTNFVSAGAAQLHDLADAPGNWFNNPVFSYLHTQDPRVGGSGMDDRFDIIFGSGELFDGVGIDYVPDSYRVFGNNGTHTFDSDITTGTGASVDVLAALAAASDHLPVIADFELLDVTPGVRVVQTGGGTKVIEGGLFDTYQVVLNTAPSANVTVTVTPDAQMDLGNGAGGQVSLVFTPGNALTPQTIIVNAANDLLLEGNHTGQISHTSASADLDYHELSIAGVTVQIVDNDAPTIVINEVDADQTSIDTAEFVELYDGGVGNVSLAGMTLVFFNGATDQAYFVLSLDGYFTNENGFFVVGSSIVPNVGHEFSSASNNLQNGQDAVALYSGAFSLNAPVTTVNLLDAIVYDTGQAADPGLLVLLESGEPQVNENQNGAGATQSLSRVPDGGDPRQTSTYIAQAPTPGAPNQLPFAGVLITQSGTRVDVQEGGATDSYLIALATIPSADVTITIDPDEQTDLGNGAGVAIMLTFTPANALVPQMVNVAAADDLIVEGTHTSVITHTAASVDSAYNGIVIGNVVANVLDNDVAPPTSIVISEIMYNPASDETSPGIAEWIEIVNVGSGTVDLGNWLLDDEDATNWGPIPVGTMLSAGQIAVLFDAAFTTVATFRAEWSIPSSALVVGITWGNLANTPSPTNEMLELRDSGGELIDSVNYDDANPWPTIGGSGGPSIYLKHVSLDNNEGSNWARSTEGVRNAISPTGPTYSTADVGTPGWLPLAGDYNSNGVVDAADFSVWRDTLGSTTDLRADGSGSVAGVPDGVVDQFDYLHWQANFGAVLSLGSGAGGGSGQLAAVTVAVEEKVQLPDFAETAGAAAAVDAALAEFASVSAHVRGSLARASAIIRQGSNEIVATSASNLLLAEPAEFRRKPVFNVLESASAVGYQESVDELFAALDQYELIAIQTWQRLLPASSMGSLAY